MKRESTMTRKGWNLEKDLTSIRKEFPLLERCVYLISNSLGAVPRQASDNLQKYYRLWAEEGVSAWGKKWWDISRQVGNEVASLIGARDDEITMLANATIAHWVALSTKFLSEDRKRNRIVMTDMDFPSEIYAVTEIASFMDWELKIVKSYDQIGIDVNDILKEMDDRTLFVATSHVYFKSGYVQEMPKVAAKARDIGALTLIDGYHAPGTLPVDVKKLDVDFYVGGCLKWLCGGPGNAFLYVRPEIASSLKPRLTGWFAHHSPFLFTQKMEYTNDTYRYMAGTPSISSLYTVLPGLDIIKKIGIHQIRKKSLNQTSALIKEARQRGFPFFTPEEKELRGGAVSINLPHAFAVKQALEKRKIMVDFRKGLNEELDVIRVGPHFYTEDTEIEILFKEIDDILHKGEFKKYSQKINHVT